jgi:hypothetical protein
VRRRIIDDDLASPCRCKANIVLSLFDVSIATVRQR